jgi:acyl-CoA synthetase (AMP-forming)/AMP-acid ligase II
MTLFDVLATSAACHGARPALTDGATGRTLDYATLLARAEALGDRLRAAGVRPGHRVGLVAGNTLGHIPAAFGVLAAGACVVPVAPSLRPAEVETLVDETDVHATLVVGDDEETTLAWRPSVRPGPEEFAGLAPAFVRFTSGTTADRKGVILSHANVLARVAAAADVLALGPEDRILWTLPLAYHFAVTITSYVRAGAHVVLASDTLPASLVDATLRTRATVLYGSPVQFERMAGAGRAMRLEAVRVALSTAAPLRASIAERFQAAFGVPLGQAYGIIEAGLPCINRRDDDAPATSVGRASPGYEVALAGDDGVPVPTGSPGEVLVRGAGLFSGYYRPWQPLARVLHDGWFATGDVGLLDAAGRLTLVGRTKSTIIVAGMKVFPEEVEAFLERQPGVREARVFGHEHPRLGEIPCAEVVTADTSLDVRALVVACARELSSHKVPVEIRVVAALPRTAGGKLLRRSGVVSPRG